MRSLIVYYSEFGNTRQVAEAIGELLGSDGTTVVQPLDQLTVAALDGIDFLVLGTPTHRMKLPEAVGPLLDRLPKRALRGKTVAAFDTSYKMSPLLARMTAAKKLAKRLRKLGGRLAVAPETFHVVEREGPLYEGEIERAREWAQAIRSHLDTSRYD